MQKTLKTLFVASALFSAMGVMASPVSLGTVEHLYGTDAGRQLPSISSIYHPGGNCDTPNATSMTVFATKSSSCNRFADVFDFSGIAFDAIDHFEMTIVFSGAQGSLEKWQLRSGYDYVHSATDAGQLNASGTQMFVINSANTNFSKIVQNEDFLLAFAQTGFAGTKSNFNLSSAKLELFGTPTVTNAVPEPGSLALVGLALAALAAARRNRKNSAA